MAVNLLSCQSLPSQFFLPLPGFVSSGEMVDRSPGNEKTPVFAFYDYHTLPLPPYNITTMLDYVVSRVQRPLDRIFVGLDPQRTSADVLGVMQALSNCHLEYFEAKESHRVVSAIWQQISGVRVSGTLLLISDATAAFALTVKMIQLNGWKCVAVHPPKLCPQMLSLAVDSIVLPICDEREQKRNHVRLYERRRRRDSSQETISSGETTAREAPGYLQWDTVSVDPELIIEALKTRNDFPEELLLEYLAIPPCSSCSCHWSTSPASLLGLREAPLLPNNPKSKTVVRWKKDAVNHEKMADCTKNAQQCPKWNNKIHTVLETNCKMWHPTLACSYYPRCHWKAELCGFAHPFCSNGLCRCPPNAKDPQKNHYVKENS